MQRAGYYLCSYMYLQDRSKVRFQGLCGAASTVAAPEGIMREDATNREKPTKPPWKRTFEWPCLWLSVGGGAAIILPNLTHLDSHAWLCLSLARPSYRTVALILRPRLGRTVSPSPLLCIRSEAAIWPQNDVAIYTAHRSITHRT